MTTLQYRTFNQLLDEVRIDFHVYDLEGMIETPQLIKVAQRVSYDLGLKLNGSHERLLDLVNGVARLPEDFHSLQSAFLCGKYEVSYPVPMGTHTEEVILDSACCTKCGQPDPTCACEKTYTVCDNVHVKLVHKTRTCTRTYNEFQRLSFKSSSNITPECAGYFRDGQHTAQIKNGFIYTEGIQNGKIYITYLGALIDEEGNLLVLDHPMINEYYEYAIKQRILENLYMNGEDVIQRIQLIEQRLRSAKLNALSIVNTPDFREMYNVWKANRQAMYAKYYYPFL